MNVLRSVQYTDKLISRIKALKYVTTSTNEILLYTYINTNKSLRVYIVFLAGLSSYEERILLANGIAIAAFNRKISLLTSKLNIELENKLVRCYVWSIVLL